ncbi:MAG: UbiX family flavin prenyltransferase [Acidobacteria bacterium]|nr:UbiX family flavin prenyltransferase [Acidobacteriota bacterium]
MRAEIALIVSGASGAALSRHLARRALEWGADHLHVVMTGPGGTVAAHELGPGWGTARGFCAGLGAEHQDHVSAWEDDDLMAPIASGSNRLRGVVIAPCSAGMAGAVANGISRGLGQRVADVALKQRWPLVLGIRETPMSAVLLKNLLELARAGAHIVPPVPAFYLRPDPGSAWDIFMDHYSLRVMDLLGFELPGKGLRWKA